MALYSSFSELLSFLVAGATNIFVGGEPQIANADTHVILKEDYGHLVKIDTNYLPKLGLNGSGEKGFSSAKIHVRLRPYNEQGFSLSRSSQAEPKVQVVLRNVDSAYIPIRMSEGTEKAQGPSHSMYSKPKQTTSNRPAGSFAYDEPQTSARLKSADFESVEAGASVRPIHLQQGFAKSTPPLIVNDDFPQPQKVREVAGRNKVDPVKPIVCVSAVPVQTTAPQLPVERGKGVTAIMPERREQVDPVPTISRLVPQQAEAHQPVVIAGYDDVRVAEPERREQVDLVSEDVSNSFREEETEVRQFVAVESDDVRVAEPERREQVDLVSEDVSNSFREEETEVRQSVIAEYNEVSTNIINPVVASQRIVVPQSVVAQTQNETVIEPVETAQVELTPTSTIMPLDEPEQPVVPQPVAAQIQKEAVAEPVEIAQVEQALTNVSIVTLDEISPNKSAVSPVIESESSILVSHAAPEQAQNNERSLAIPTKIEFEFEESKPLTLNLVRREARELPIASVNQGKRLNSNQRIIEKLLWNNQFSLLPSIVAKSERKRDVLSTYENMVLPVSESLAHGNAAELPVRNNEVVQSKALIVYTPEIFSLRSSINHQDNFILDDVEEAQPILEEKVTRVVIHDKLYTHNNELREGIIHVSPLWQKLMDPNFLQEAGNAFLNHIKSPELNEKLIFDLYFVDLQYLNMVEFFIQRHYCDATIEGGSDRYNNLSVSEDNPTPPPSPLKGLARSSVTPDPSPLKGLATTSETPEASPFKVFATLSVTPDPSPLKGLATSLETPEASPLKGLATLSVTPEASPFKVFATLSVTPDPSPLKGLATSLETPEASPLKGLATLSVTPEASPLKGLATLSVTPEASPLKGLATTSETPEASPLRGLATTSETPDPSPLKGLATLSVTPDPSPLKGLATLSVTPDPSPLKGLATLSVTPDPSPLKGLATTSETPESSPLKGLARSSVTPDPSPLKGLARSSVTPDPSPLKGLATSSVTPPPSPLRGLAISLDTPEASPFKVLNNLSPLGSNRSAGKQPLKLSKSINYRGKTIDSDIKQKLQFPHTTNNDNIENELY